MQKKSAILLFTALLLSLSGCSTKQESANETTTAASIAGTTIAEETTSSAVTTLTTTLTEAVTTQSAAAETAVSGTYTAQKAEKTAALKNKMSAFERACAVKRPFSLLNSDLPETTVGIGTLHTSKEAQIAMYQQLTGISEEELKQWIDEAEDYSNQAALINGVEYTYFIPPKGYDGGKLVIGDGIEYKDKEAFFAYTEDEYCKDNHFTAAQTEKLLRQMKAVFDAVISGKYTALPEREKDFNIPFIEKDPFADYRSKWTYDADALAAIKEHIEEYTLYDEQLGLRFVVHVTLPPHYDAAKSYPVILLTDGVWRLNDHAAMYQAMEQGEAAEVLLVSLAPDCNIDGTDDRIRDVLFVKDRDKMLDFVNDDLMPYLSEQYHIDCTDSTLFGHSMGGVFSHYACFKSDQYENQPFFRYIIGSPALFNLYNEAAELDYDAAGAVSEYGYFDRNDTLCKKVFLCGGMLEDPDYADAYNGNDSLLTGLRKMQERIAAHKADYTYKLYDSHHYQYVPGMLLEFLKAEYPAK